MTNIMASDWLDKVDDDGWLDIGSSAPTDANAHKVPYEALIFACMRGSNRVWACDGNYVAYRPFNREFDKEVNPAFQERIERFRAEGNMEYVGTSDEVQIYKLLEGNVWKTKDDAVYVAGKNYWQDIRQAARYATDRKWTDYHDLLEAMATGMKAGRDPEIAKMVWENALDQIAITTYQMQGPTPAECNAAMQSVRAARGMKTRSSIIVPDLLPRSKNEVQYER